MFLEQLPAVARLISACIASLAMLALAPSSSHAQTRVIVDGSTGTAPLIAALGKAFTAKGGPVVEIGHGLGTQARLAALAGGRIDVAMASHGLDVDDVKRRRMSLHLIAKTAVVFAVHESVKLGSLTQEQVCAIYEGSHKNWKELGGADLVIVAHVRPDKEVPSEIMREIVGCLKAMKFPETVKVMDRGGDMLRALVGTPGAFGIASATDVEQSKGKLTALALDGIAASEDNIAAGRYRMVRDAFLVIRDDASNETRAFIDFVRSPEGAAVIRANGAIATGR